MAQAIVISGHTLTGKTLVALGLARYLRNMGKRVSYIKPIGEVNDEDATVMKQVLGIKVGIDSIMPVARTRVSFDEFLKTGHDELLERIMKACQHRKSHPS
jgi:BioD-like phosphotransacetylase family protein